MKNFLTDVVKELQKEYTKFSIALIIILNIAGLFTPLIVNQIDIKLKIISIISFTLMGLSIFPTLIALLTVAEKRAENTTFSKKSIATLFVKNADHMEVNFTTIAIILSIIYIILGVLTHMIFPVGCVIWIVTILSILLGNFWGQSMLKTIIQKSIKWFKTELPPILIVGSLFILSLAFMYYLIVGSFTILLGGKNLFTSTVWYLILIAMLYFASLFTTQLLKSETVNKYEKTKSTIQYVLIIVLMSYLTISNGHFTLLAIAYTCAIIGAITGHCLPNHIDK